MCWYCGSPITFEEPLGRSLRCEDCGKDLRVCKNCRFYLPGSRGDCSESSAEPPSEKDRANFCDWFSLNPAYRRATAGRKNDREKASAAKAAFDDLFT
jgi:predicted amidophosphoribosyltransferase